MYSHDNRYIITLSEESVFSIYADLGRIGIEYRGAVM